MNYLEARLRQPGWMLHPIQTFIREESVVEYEELQAWNTRVGEPLEYELFYVEADREPYENELASIDSVEWYDIEPVSEGSFYVYICQRTREEDVDWREAFYDLDLVVVPPVVYDTDAAFRITVVGDSDSLQALLEGIPDSIDVTVLAIGEYDRRYAPIADGVTDRQLDAVEAAVETGFYEVPRTGDLADVAERLDCARSTASTLLQKAEETVMRGLVERLGRTTAQS